MFIQNLVEKTARFHIDYCNLKLALSKMMEVTSYVDNREKEFENIRKVILVQEQFSGKFPWLALPHRKFVREGALVDSNTLKQRRWFLFNDILVITKSEKEAKYHVLNVFHLADISICEISKSSALKNDCEIVLNVQQTQSYKTLKYLAPAPSQSVSWKTDLTLLQKSLSSSIASIDPTTIPDITNVSLRSPKKKAAKKRQKSFRKSLSLSRTR